MSRNWVLQETTVVRETITKVSNPFYRKMFAFFVTNHFTYLGLKTFICDHPFNHKLLSLPGATSATS